MRFSGLQPATLVSRANRFAAWVEWQGELRYVHVPNSGRLSELLIAGAAVLWKSASSTAGAGVAENVAGQRKTAGDLVLVRCGRRWVCVDARLPPRLLAEALTGPRGIEPFGRCAEPVFEPPLGEGRADLAIACAGTTWIVETKCVTLAHDGVALFPDAPTERGRRHLAHLAALTSTGSLRPAVAFICQRPDVYCFQPNADTDPLFSKALAEAARSGVLVAAYRCNVNTRGIAIAEQIPAYLGGDER